MLRKTVIEATQRATQTQALKKITTGAELLPPAADNGVQYLLFQAQTLNQKPVTIASSASSAASVEKKPFRDPFAKEHLEQDLFITQVHGTHNLVLNKFNIVDEHVRVCSVLLGIHVFSGCFRVQNQLTCVLWMDVDV